MNEAELIERAAAGGSDAFGALVAPHLGLFFNGILRILGNRADTQDALPDPLRLVFVLKDLEGWSTEAARALEVTLRRIGGPGRL